MLTFKFLRTVGFRGVSALISFLAIYLVTKKFGAEASAPILFSFTLTSWMLVFCSSGVGVIIIRECSNIELQKKNEERSGVFNAALLLTLCASFVVISLVFLLQNLGLPIGQDGIIEYLLSLPALCFIIVVSSFLQAKSLNEIACLIQNILVWLFFAVFFFVFYFMLSYEDLNHVGVIYSGVAYASAFLSGIYLFNKYKFKFSFEFKLSEVRDLWIYQVCIATVSLGGVILAKFFSNPLEYASLNLSFRLSFAVNMILVVVGSVIMPYFSRMISKGDYVNLRLLYKRSHYVMVLIGLFVFLVCFIFQDIIMAFFGDGFYLYSHMLIIAVIPQVIGLFVGPVISLLNMLGEQAFLRKTNIVLLVIFLMAVFVFRDEMSFLWYSILLSSVISMQSIIPFLYLKRKKHI